MDRSFEDDIRTCRESFSGTIMYMNQNKEGFLVDGGVALGVLPAVTGVGAVIEGAIATGQEIQNGNYLPAVLDALGTLGGVVGLGFTTVSFLTTDVEREALDTGQAFADLTRTANNEQEIADNIAKLSATMAGLQLTYSRIESQC